MEGVWQALLPCVAAKNKSTPIKNALGFNKTSDPRQLSMRGLKEAKAEFKLVSMALNLRRMEAMQAG